jgi:hypothetical protein
MMNADEKIRYEGLIGQGPSVRTPAQIALLRSYDHNWQDDLLRQICSKQQLFILRWY